MDAADGLVERSVLQVRAWLADADAGAGRAEVREAARLRALGSDREGARFALAFLDRVLRPESAAVAAEQMRALVRGPLPRFLAPLDRALLKAGARVAPLLPRVVMPLARRRLRRLVGGLVVDRDERALGVALRALAAEGFDVNVNPLGELVLGEEEAERRRDETLALLQRPDVRTVSVKASSIASQIQLFAYAQTLERVKERLRPVLSAAAACRPPRLVNLDMEAYDEFQLTLDAFTQLLDEPALRGLEAGIVLQAYLPDSFDALRALVAWADRRAAAGGAGIRVRLVKGANLAMERVEAALHGWEQSPYASKPETDANYKRLLDWALRPERLRAVRIGVASHNLFDVAYAHLLAAERGVAERVEFEMLKGMAPALARAVRATTGSLLLYTPVVAEADWASALAYLFRRFEENASGENFLRHLFALSSDAGAFGAQRGAFARAVAERASVSSQPRRRVPRPCGARFENVADSDPTDPAARDAILSALAERRMPVLPSERTAAEVDAVVSAAAEGAREWRARSPEERRALLLRVADAIAARRPQLIAVMAGEAAKTVAEGDGEVSEAVDFARYYAAHVPELERRAAATFEPLGVVLVVPPWNFPISIPAGGVLAALAAGNAVILKPAPQTPRCVLALAEACWAAGVPQGTLQYARCPDGEVGERLVAHPGVHGIVLTGAYETAELFARLAPQTPLFAETSGKNAMVILPDADLDLAVGDLVRSAFGHAGQKCSAASLAICVGGVADSARFRRQLVDAARSLLVADPSRPEAAVGPLIGAPTEKLLRALTRPAPGERWLLEPHPVAGAPQLWSPGILDGVEPGSWFHRTECFGPVLGLLRARDLDEALALQNAVDYGLTGGIHTLDPAHAEAWLARVQVGNAYVNRAITGAVVQRQPFGGWKRSVVGPGAKAGGPNYVAQLGHWRSCGAPANGREPCARVAALVQPLLGALGPEERRRLVAAARSDAECWERELGAEHDPSALFCESNVFRYRPLASLALRVAADARPFDVARVLVGLAALAAAPTVSVDPGYAGPLAALAHHREDAAAFAARMRSAAFERVRALGTGPGTAPSPATFVDRRPVVDDARIELARFLREQTVSRTLHRFGNVTQAPR